MGTMMRQLYKQLRIHKITTTLYHPQTDGMVERFNATLKSMLRKSLSAFQGQWDEALPFVLENTEALLAELLALHLLNFC